MSIRREAPAYSDDRNFIETTARWVEERALAAAGITYWYESGWRARQSRPNGWRVPVRDVARARATIAAAIGAPPPPPVVVAPRVATPTAAVEPVAGDTPVPAIFEGLTFGVELECIGLNRESVAETLADAFGTRYRRDTNSYDKHSLPMGDGSARRWTVVSDQSLTGGREGDNAEVVSPILTYADMDRLQQVVRLLRKAGCTVDESCGMHVHVGAAGITNRAVAALATMMVNEGEPLAVALGVSEERREDMCKPFPESVAKALHAVAKDRPTELIYHGNSWAGTAADGFYTAMANESDYSEQVLNRGEHYNPARYYDLNLHSVWFRGTMEFRAFEGTLHAGEVRANVCLALALVAAAKRTATSILPLDSVKAAPHRARDTASLFMALLMSHLRLTGEVFANVRQHLCQRVCPVAKAALDGQTLLPFTVPVAPPLAPLWTAHGGIVARPQVAGVVAA